MSSTTDQCGSFNVSTQSRHNLGNRYTCLWYSIPPRHASECMQGECNQFHGTFDPAYQGKLDSTLANDLWHWLLINKQSRTQTLQEHCQLAPSVVNIISWLILGLIADLLSFSARFPDHALELQALKFAMEQSGACTAIDAIIKAGGVTNPSAASQKQSLLSNMFDQINGQGNAFSLDTNVNGAVSELTGWTILVLEADIHGQKKLVVQAGLPQGAGCTASPSTELKKAINAYFTDPSINGPTRALATTLDGLANTAVNTAATNAQAAINCKDGSTTRLQNAKNSALQAVTAGKVRHFRK